MHPVPMTGIYKTDSSAKPWTRTVPERICIDSRVIRRSCRIPRLVCHLETASMASSAMIVCPSRRNSNMAKRRDEEKDPQEQN